jgi:hypothetical protein
MRLAWWRDDGAIGDHGLHNVRGDLLSIFADFGAIVAMAVDACPDEQNEVDHETSELAHHAGQLDILTMRLCLPELVDISVLFRAIFETRTVRV